MIKAKREKMIECMGKMDCQTSEMLEVAMGQVEGQENERIKEEDTSLFRKVSRVDKYFSKEISTSTDNIYR